MKLEVALDSGATDNLCHSGDVPVYVLEAFVARRKKVSLLGMELEFPMPAKFT